MHIQRRLGTTCGLALSLAMATSLGLTAVAQEATVEGLVIGRDGPSMSVRTADTQRLTVLLSGSTKATQKGGFLGIGRKDLGVAALVPGLSVKVEGDYNPDHQLVAKKVTFSRNSLTTARQIDAGLQPVNAQVAAAQDQLKSDRRDIDQTQADTAKNAQDIDATKQGLAATNEATLGNTSAIGQTKSRIGQLDTYETKGSITVNFANGKATVSKKDRDQLTDFVKSAADTPGYMIEVQGYASPVGSAALNQRLSAERADAVLAIIQQTGVVPMTRILAPAAMGTTNPVSTDHTRSAQAENRRVVVTIVVNKGITG
jgi:outer membrane protein OmpA-like peptidoglycan-associated protein